MNAFSESDRRVVITGLGLLSPAGIGREEFWSNIAAGRSAIGPLSLIHGTASPDDLGGEVAGFNDGTIKKQFFTEKEQRKSVKVMCREIQMGTAAALMALSDAGIDMNQINKERIGIDFGAHLMCSPPEDLELGCYNCVHESDPVAAFHYEDWGTKGLERMDPLWLLRYLPNMPACHIAIFTDARGPSNSLTLDEAVANLVMSEATRIILRGDADAMITGSTGTRVSAVRSMHTALFDDLARGGPADGTRCRPFDRDRTGQIPAEGACAIILEAEDHAQARGATILGRVLGTASSCVIGKDSSRGDTRKALANAMRKALLVANLQPADIGHIHANASGSRVGDLEEARAIHDVFGEHGSKVPVTSLKSYVGNSGSGCGSQELAASLLGLRHGVIPPTLNCEHPDPECDLNVVRGEPLPTKNRIVMNINVTRMGQASVLIARVD